MTKEKMEGPISMKMEKPGCFSEQDSAEKLLMWLVQVWLKFKKFFSRIYCKNLARTSVIRIEETQPVTRGLTLKDTKFRTEKIFINPSWSSEKATILSLSLHFVTDDAFFIRYETEFYIVFACVRFLKPSDAFPLSLCVQ